MYSVIFFCLATLTALVLLILSVPPATLFPIFLFLVILFLFTGTLLSILFFFRLRKTSPKLMHDNLVYKKAVKWGFYASFIITGFLFLKGFNLLVFVNLSLFVILCFMLYLQIQGNR
jgi:hypothetical protein